jgi:hypothetical protein
MAPSAMARTRAATLGSQRDRVGGKASEAIPPALAGSPSYRNSPTALHPVYHLAREGAYLARRCPMDGCWDAQLWGAWGLS